MLTGTTGASTLFAPGSVWNQQLPANAALDPASARIADALAAEARREYRVGIGPWITPGAMIYEVGPSQPTVRVQLDNPTLWWRVSLRAAFTAVPMPANAQPGSDADGEITVWQPSTDKLWEFFHLRKLSDGWHAAWGGAIQNASQSPGYYNTSFWPGALPVWGATASSLPHAAGVVTLNEIQQGQINHALAINLPYPRASVYAWPAQRTDGTGTDPNGIPEGAHLRLDPNVDISYLKRWPLVYEMAQAAQKYGMIVRDQTHHAIDFWIQSSAPTGTNPFYCWSTAMNSNQPCKNGPFQGYWPTYLMIQFPWSSVQVLKMELHRS